MTPASSLVLFMQSSFCMDQRFYLPQWDAWLVNGKCPCPRSIRNRLPGVLHGIFSLIGNYLFRR